MPSLGSCRSGPDHDFGRRDIFFLQTGPSTYRRIRPGEHWPERMEIIRSRGLHFPGRGIDPSQNAGEPYDSRGPPRFALTRNVPGGLIQLEQIGGPRGEEHHPEGREQQSASSRNAGDGRAPHATDSRVSSHPGSSTRLPPRHSSLFPRRTEPQLGVIVTGHGDSERRGNRRFGYHGNAADLAERYFRDSDDYPFTRYPRDDDEDYYTHYGSEDGDAGSSSDDEARSYNGDYISNH